MIAMLAISQNPERVSNILRSSTAVIRVSGYRLDGRAGDADAGLLRWRSCRCSFSLGGGGELEEHLFEAGAGRRPAAR